MSNTQARMFDLHEAIERDRSARMAEAAEQDATADMDEELDSSPWELWLAIGVGLLVIAVAAAI